MVIIKRSPYESVGIIISERLDRALFAHRIAQRAIRNVGCTAARPHISYAKQQLRITDNLLRQVTTGVTHGQH